MPATTLRKSIQERDVQLDPSKSKLLTRSKCEIDVLLFDLLSQRTPSGKEEPFRDQLCEYLKKNGVDQEKVSVDTKGNLWVYVGDAPYNTMFSSHMDTVHRVDGRQRLVITTDGAGADKAGFVYAIEPKYEYALRVISEGAPINLKDSDAISEYMGHKFHAEYWRIEIVPEDKVPDLVKEQAKAMDSKLGAVRQVYISMHNVATKHSAAMASNLVAWAIGVPTNFSRTTSVLGADDRVGIYIMLRMIENKIPGLYIFHVEEESGGHGSSWIALNKKDQIKDIKRAVAFDRMHYDDIIGSQRGGVCCSLEFQRALAEQLNPTLPPMRKFKAGAVGTFTDTANYRNLIPECTNLSIGYFNQHTHDEHFDYIWLVNFLVPAVLKVEWDKLPTVRDPFFVPPPYKHTPVTTNYYGVKKSDNVLEPLYWAQRKKVAPWLVTTQTPFSRIPLWEPVHGTYNGQLKGDALKLVIGKWIMFSPTDTNISALIVGLLEDRTKLYEEKALLEKQLQAIASAEHWGYA